MMDQLNQINEKNLLRLAVALDKMQGELSEEMSKPNIFIAAGLLSQEIKHSSILAFLLDPSEWHGLGDSLLKKIIVKAGPEERALKVILKSLAAARVYREVSVHGAEKEGEKRNGRIDVLVVDEDSKIIVAIENKVYAKQASGQLSKYRVWLEKKYPDCELFLVFLTLFAEEPDDDAWSIVSYEDLALAIRELGALRRSKISELGNTYLTNYVDLIERFLMEQVSPEIEKYCRELWVNYGPLLEHLVGYQPTPIIEAIKLFSKEYDKEISYVKSRKDRLVFFAKGLVEGGDELCKLKELPEGDGWAGSYWGWDNDFRYPLRLEFYFDQSEQDVRIKFSVIVGPWGNEERRKEFIKTAGAGLNAKGAKSNTKKFTPIFNSDKTISSTYGDSIFVEMQRMYVNFKNKSLGHLKENIKEYNQSV